MISSSTTGLRVLAFSLCSALALASTSDLAQASTQPYITSHQINFGTGNKYLSVTDVRLPCPGQSLSFQRTYNSQSDETTVMGYGWSTNLTERLDITTTTIKLIQAGGRVVHFKDNGSGQWINEIGSKRVITTVTGGYQLTEPSGTVKLYDTSGNLLSRTDRNGNSLTYTYNGTDLTSIANSFGRTISFTYANNLLASATSALGTVSYTYDTNNNLETITKPDGTSIDYIYDDPNDIHNLTGVIDEENNRVLTVAYDSSDRVISSAKADGSQAVTIEYPATYMRRVTNSLGVTTSYNLDVSHGVVAIDSFTGPGCSSCGSDGSTKYLYNERLQVLTATDENDTVTTYTYDEQGNRTTITEATGTELEQVTSKTYTPENRVATITVPSIANPGESAVTTFSYDNNGNLISQTQSGYVDTTAISATTAYTYNSYGQILSIDGPRTDVNDSTTFTYYPNDAAQGNDRAQLHTVVNALGHTTTYADYNLFGQAETITDTNGLVTTRSYDGNGRLSTSTSAGLTTGYSYDNTGKLLTITLPDARVITYTYTAAGQIESLADDQGNTITFTYDSEGRQIGQQINDSTDTLTWYADYGFDDAGRMNKVELPQGYEETSHYDLVGNLVKTVNGNGNETEYAYDALKRLLSITEAGDTTAQYSYDANDNIIEVTDSDNQVTLFTYDDLGRRITRDAPDTGLSSYTYDPAGNILAITDAKAQTMSLDYDILGRMTTQGIGTETITYGYDSGTNAIGRLSSIQDQEGNRTFTYNDMGRLAIESRTIGSASYQTSYAWSTTTGELTGMTYPSGLPLTFTRGTDGQIADIQLNGTALVADAEYLPFGPLKSVALGATLGIEKEYDARYNLTRIQSGGLDYIYTRDGAGQVGSIENIQVPTFTDESTTLNYDSTSNQLSDQVGTVNKSYTFDANGNITSDSVFSFSYDGLNRMIEVSDGTGVVAIYGYDSNNRRIRKTVGATTIHYHYDSNSQLIGESLADGTALRDYIYLNGELIAVKEYQNSPGLYYVINDHLGTPQRLVDTIGTVVWQAGYYPYGKAQVQVETVVNNIRFPGQYFDSETGLHYNWHRFYDPDGGRYVTADPVGLDGGINLYAYANQNPISYIDPEGLAYFANRPLGGLGGIFGVVGGKRDDQLNTVIGHEQLFFQDGKKDPNVGFFDDGKVKTEPNPQGYEPSHDSGWNDCVMREAVNRVPKRRYKLLWERNSKYKYNCQDWADEVRKMYRKLIKDPAIVQRCNPSCSEMNK